MPLIVRSLALALLFAVTAAAADAAVPFGDTVIFRDSLSNSRIQFERSKKGTVAFLGGSITEMDGYRPMVCELLAKRFPDTRFTTINAGIGSTTSTTGAFRLEHDVLDKGPIDLLFVEFAVNDDQDCHHTRTECIRGMEGIIRHARRVNPNIDLVVTYFVNESMLKTLQAQGTPLTIEAHGAVTKHYAISTINLAREVAQEITAGTLTWAAYGGVHPARAGNAIAAAMIDELFNRAWPSPLAPTAQPQPHAAPAEPLDPLNYGNGRFIDPAKAQVKQGWTFGVPDWKAIPGGKRDQFVTPPMLSATAAGAEASLAFEGTAVGAFIVAGPDAGIVDASIDGGPFTPVNLLHAFSQGLHYPRTVMLGTDLPPGAHRLTVRMSSETTSKSAGHAMRIYQFVAN